MLSLPDPVCRSFAAGRLQKERPFIQRGRRAVSLTREPPPSRQRSGSCPSCDRHPGRRGILRLPGFPYWRRRGGELLPLGMGAIYLTWQILSSIIFRTCFRTPESPRAGR